MPSLFAYISVIKNHNTQQKPQQQYDLDEIPIHSHADIQCSKSAQQKSIFRIESDIVVNVFQVL